MCILYSHPHLQRLKDDKSDSRRSTPDGPSCEYTPSREGSTAPSENIAPSLENATPSPEPRVVSIEIATPSPDPRSDPDNEHPQSSENHSV